MVDVILRKGGCRNNRLLNRYVWCNFTGVNSAWRFRCMPKWRMTPNLLYNLYKLSSKAQVDLPVTRPHYVPRVLKGVWYCDETREKLTGYASWLRLPHSLNTTLHKAACVTVCHAATSNIIPRWGVCLPVVAVFQERYALARYVSSAHQPALTATLALAC